MNLEPNNKSLSFAEFLDAATRDKAEAKPFPYTMEVCRCRYCSFCQNGKCALKRCNTLCCTFITILKILLRQRVFQNLPIIPPIILTTSLRNIRVYPSSSIYPICVLRLPAVCWKRRKCLLQRSVLSVVSVMHRTSLWALKRNMGYPPYIIVKVGKKHEKQQSTTGNLYCVWEIAN